jgi:hypothetical protein
VRHKRREGEVWRYHDGERVRIRADFSGYWFRADSQGRYARWTGPYTTEEVAFQAAVRFIQTGFTGEVNGGN